MPAYWYIDGDERLHVLGQTHPDLDAKSPAVLVTVTYDREEARQWEKALRSGRYPDVKAAPSPEPLPPYRGPGIAGLRPTPS